MRTKHLFLATALVASFAACSNEDLFEAPQNVAKDGRPTVSDVKLNFTGDADTRLTFGSTGYAWESTDVIGALLMDEVNTVDPSKSWIEKYTLTPYIHTSYPFTYNTEDKTWGCNAKMLEGNYFFAFPWESYDGNRQVTHSITGQQQNGVKGSVVAESYAKNQFFVGYSQIKAGKDAKDVLNDVEMTPILGAIRLDIVNTGTQTYHIQKIVLKGSQLASVLTVDPTDASYAGGNLVGTKLATLGASKWKNSNNYFNYANYTDNDADVYKAGGADVVYNAVGSYNRQAALKAAIQEVGSDTYAQLVINGTEAERELVSTKVNEKAVAYALIMANPVASVNPYDLNLDIYCDEGLVANIDLTHINSSSSSYRVITDSKVEAIGSDVKNTIKVQVDDNSFEVPATMDIYRAEDLQQFIAWNARINGTRAITATLKEDVTLSKEMFDLLKKSANVTLTIKGSETLTLAKELPADALDYAKMNLARTIAVEVEGALTLTKDSKTVNKLTVLEGATLTIDTKDAQIPTLVTNNGTLEIGADALIKNKTIENNGTMNVAQGADVKGANTPDIVNYGTLNNNGYMRTLTNAADAVVNLGEGASLLNATNNGTIYTAKNAQVSGTNNKYIYYVSGAVITANGGSVIAEAPATLTKDTFKDTKVNSIVLKKGITSVTTDVTMTTIIVADGAELNVAKGKTLKATDLTFEGAASVSGEGTVEAANVEVKEEATLTNHGTIVATSTFENNGMVYNNGTVKSANYSTLNGGNNWKYNPAVNYTTPTPAPETVTYKLNVTIDSSSSAIAPTSASVLTGDNTNAIDVTFKNFQEFYLFMSNKEFVNKDNSNDKKNYKFPANTDATVESITIKTNASSPVDYVITAETEKNVYGYYDAVNHYSYVKEMVAGKDVTMSNNAHLSGLTNSMALSMKSLTTFTAKISGTQNMVILTVDNLKTGTQTFTIADGYLKISGSSQIGVGSEKINAGGTINGTIVTEDSNGNLIKWDNASKKWIALG